MGLNIVVKQDGHHRPRDTGHHHLAPHLNGVPAHRGLGGCFALEGPHLFPEQDHHRQDRPQLDDHKEHILECLTDIHL